MAISNEWQPPSPEFLAETNDPYLDQRVSIAFIVVDTFFRLLFYVSSYLNKRAVGLPMLVCNTLCYILCLGSAATGILMTQIGRIGQRIDAVPVSTFQVWLQLSKVLKFTYTPAVMFAKLAALFLCNQVFDLSLYRRIIIGSGYFWTQAVDVNDGTCGEVTMFYKGCSIRSLVTDLAMLALSWPILLKLNIPTSEKIGLTLTFLAASLGIFTYALRFAVFFTVPLFSDPTWYASGPMIYALVESSIYMIASILTTTRHLYRPFRRKSQLARRCGVWRVATAARETRNDYRSTDGERLGSRETANHGITRHVGIQQANTNSSQEELILVQRSWTRDQQECDEMDDYEREKPLEGRA